MAGMAKHAEHAGVQDKARETLCIISANPENQVKVVKAGGIDAILKGMAKHENIIIIIILIAEF